MYVWFSCHSIWSIKSAPIQRLQLTIASPKLQCFFFFLSLQCYIYPFVWFRDVIFDSNSLSTLTFLHAHLRINFFKTSPMHTHISDSDDRQFQQNWIKSHEIKLLFLLHPIHLNLKEKRIHKIFDDQVFIKWLRSPYSKYIDAHVCL